MHIDITTNVKVIEFLKGEMLTDVAELFKLMNKDSKEVRDTILDIPANVIIESYVLGRRMGISYDSVDLQVKEKLRAGIQENNDMEKWYKDLSTLNNKMSKH
jgi:hypothetical protein